MGLEFRPDELSWGGPPLPRRRAKASRERDDVFES